MVELIKNSFDADATRCEVSLDQTAGTLIISDTGTGMNLDDFLSKWMRIATDSKRAVQASAKYRRPLTGAKGIGRFAVRFLGDTLDLETVAYSSKLGCNTRLHAAFDWEKIDATSDLSATKIPYEVYKADPSATTGTTLTIGELKGGSSVVFSREIRTQVLRLTSPLAGLGRGHFRIHDSADDPGFAVYLPDRADETAETGLSKIVLDNCWAKLNVSLQGQKLRFEVYFRGETKPRYVHPAVGRYEAHRTNLSNGLFVDIRFFPRRSGIFSGKGFDGRTAWSWIRENSGVSIVDHGFRVKPYGFGDDDWLLLDSDNARNYRNWRSSLMLANYPIPEEYRKAPSLNPMFNLPSSLQLVGAVSVESNQTARSGEDLVPSTDREGFIQNAAFRELWEIVRAGVEFLARADEIEEQKKLEEQAKRAQDRTRADFKAAIAYIRQSPTLTEADKNRITTEYAALAHQVEEVEAYDRRARESLETMGLLGVVAGFMTHESRRIIWNLDRAVEALEAASNKVTGLITYVATAKEALVEFKGQVEYTSTFIEAVHNKKETSFDSASQIKRVIRLFGTFADERGIHVENEVNKGLPTPALPIAVYSGIILNLYTNAIKAVLAAPSLQGKPSVVFRGWNEPSKHIVEVLDTGIGVPPNLRERIFDPLFTTTSAMNNPLGSGMGLGLSLVRKLMRDLGGNVKLVEPPNGFTTCFKLEFPLVQK